MCWLPGAWRLVQGAVSEGQSHWLSIGECCQCNEDWEMGEYEEKESYSWDGSNGSLYSQDS